MISNLKAVDSVHDEPVSMSRAQWSGTGSKQKGSQRIWKMSVCFCVDFNLPSLSSSPNQAFNAFGPALTPGPSPGPAGL